MDRQQNRVKFMSNLSHGQSLCLRNIIDGEVEEEGCSTHKNQESIWLREFKQMWECKCDKPVRCPIDEYPDCHSCISSIKRKYFCDDEPSNASRPKSEENNHSCSCHY
eukprot:814838_1